MSKSSPSVDSEKTLYVNDFVEFEHPALEGSSVGRIQRVVSRNSVEIELYGQHGPLDATYTVDTDTVRLHPKGRLSVVDADDTHRNR